MFKDKNIYNILYILYVFYHIVKNAEVLNSSNKIENKNFTFFCQYSGF